MFEDSALRRLIYDEIVRTGEAPAVSTLSRLVSANLDDVRASLLRMHDAHTLVLQPTGEILMANPFSAVPTPFVTEVGGRRWFGNCIWVGGLCGASPGRQSELPGHLAYRRACAPQPHRILEVFAEGRFARQLRYLLDSYPALRAAHSVQFDDHRGLILSPR